MNDDNKKVTALDEAEVTQPKVTLMSVPEGTECWLECIRLVRGHYSQAHPGLIMCPIEHSDTYIYVPESTPVELEL